MIAAGINLFGGPLGLIHRHVTGAIPIRRNTKDPAYLITLKAYVAEILQRHDLFFYPEGRPQLQRRAEAAEDRAAPRGAAPPERRDLVIIPTASPMTSCSRITSWRGRAVKQTQRPFRRELAEMVRYAVGYRSRAFVTFGAPIAATGCDPHSRTRGAGAGAPDPGAHRRAGQGAADGRVRRGDAAVGDAPRSRGARIDHLIERAAAQRANLG